jgi:hypothetical protein
MRHLPFTLPAIAVDPPYYEAASGTIRCRITGGLQSAKQNWLWTGWKSLSNIRGRRRHLMQLTRARRSPRRSTLGHSSIRDADRPHRLARMTLHLFAFLCLSLAAWAQDYPSPSTWVRHRFSPCRRRSEAYTLQNATSVYTHEQRLALAQGAVDVFIRDVYPAGTMVKAVTEGNGAYPSGLYHERLLSLYSDYDL